MQRSHQKSKLIISVLLLLLIEIIGTACYTINGAIRYFDLENPDKAMSARVLKSNMNKISRATNDITEAKLQIAGENINGYKFVKGKYIINSSFETILSKGIKHFVISSPEQIYKIKNILNNNIS